MQPLELNLASRPFKNDTLPWLGALLVSAGLLAVTVWNVRTYREHTVWAEDLRQQFSDSERDLTTLDQDERRAQREIEQFDVEALSVRADKANEVIRWKGFSWTRLFNHMEEVLPNNVQMTSIRPSFRPESPEDERNMRGLELEGRVPVTVEGTAKSILDFYEFEQNLFHHPHFDQVTPERTDTPDPTNGVTLFSLRFLYDPRELVQDAEPEEGSTAEAAPLDAAPAPEAAEVGEVTGDGEPVPPTPEASAETAGAGPLEPPAATDPLASGAPAPAEQIEAEPTPAEPDVQQSADALRAPAPSTPTPPRKRRPGARPGAKGGQ